MVIRKILANVRFLPLLPLRLRSDARWALDRRFSSPHGSGSGFPSHPQKRSRSEDANGIHAGTSLQF